MKLRFSTTVLLLFLLIVVHVVVVALYFILLMPGGAAYHPNQDSRYDDFLAFASVNIPSATTVAFVTPGEDDYLWDYYKASYALYPRALWWVRPTPCKRAITWCIHSSLSVDDLEKVFATLGARYVIVGNLPDLGIPAVDRIVFDQHLFILKLR